MTNRAQRRAAARGKGQSQELRGFKFGVTPDEAEILEEALAWWLATSREQLPDEPDAYQVWALERGEKLRQAFSAAVGNRPWRDVGAQRVPPKQSHLQGVFDLHAQVPCINCEDAGRSPATCCRTCEHGEAGEHYDGTCETVIELMLAMKEAEREQRRLVGDVQGSPDAARGVGAARGR